MMLVLALLAQTASPDNVVKITPTTNNGYMLELITTESAAVAFRKMTDVAEQACKATQIGAKGMPLIATVDKKPQRMRILQSVNCRPPHP